MPSKNDLPNIFRKNIELLLEEDAEKFFRSLEDEEITSIRFHPKYKSKITKDANFVPWEKLGIYLEKRPNFALDPAWHSGTYYVQESSSMLTGFVCKNLFQKPVIALDLCAAPGGKSTHLLSVLPEDSLLVSNEIIPKRNQILIENLQKWGYSHQIVTKSETQNFQTLEQYFDLVVVDAPCSGEGLFRKNAKAIDEWSIDVVKTCAQRQTKILSDIIPTIKVGGYLCYSTCTYEVSENEEQIERLIDSGLFELVPIASDTLPGVVYGKIPGTLRCWSHLVKGSGFFIALLRKIKQIDSESPSSKPRYWNWSKTKKIEENVLNFISLDEKHIFLQSGEYLRIFPEKHVKDLEYIAQHIGITHFGIDAGQLKKNIFTPSHHLVFTSFINSNIPHHNADEDEIALDFLRKKNIEVDSHLPNTWIVFTWKNIPLGWIKKNPQRINNYYPTSWMLRQ